MPVTFCFRANWRHSTATRNLRKPSLITPASASPTTRGHSQVSAPARKSGDAKRPIAGRKSQFDRPYRPDHNQARAIELPVRPETNLNLTVPASQDHG
jgi:hypothetical protein